MTDASSYLPTSFNQSDFRGVGVQNLPVDQLVPYKDNARTHSKKQIRQIADSIEAFGFTNPILMDENNQILAGHGRVAAAKLLSWETVPCIQIETLTASQKRAYILADNKLAQNAGWDIDLLSSELTFLTNELEIDIGLTGFTIAEVDEILELGGVDHETEGEEDDELPALDESACSHPGDVWQLGDHRLLCGDACSIHSYDALLKTREGIQEVAKMVFTDPPYNVPINNNVCGSGSIKHPEFAMASGEMSSSEFTEFLKSTFNLLANYSTDGSIHFICMDWRHIGEVIAAGNNCYSELKNMCVWVKDNGGMGTFYRSRHELVFVFKNGSTPHINSFELGQHGRYRTNVWNYRGVSSGSAEARKELELHPTVKPVALVADAIKDCSARGDIILDPFCGSGTVLIAAQKTGRRARAIEIDPTYCDRAIQRWQSFVHDDAILVETGETFEFVKSRRCSSAAQSTSALEQTNKPRRPIMESFSNSPWAKQ